MVLQVSKCGVARTEVPDVVFLHGAPGSGGMGVGTSYKALSEWVKSAVLLKRKPVFEHIAHHVSPMEAGNIDGQASI